MQSGEASEKWAAVQASSIIVVGSHAGGITALRAVDGMVIWDYPTPPVCALVCSRETVYAGVSSPPKVKSRSSQIMALRVRDGTMLWHTAPKALEGGPLLAVDDDKVFAVGNGGNRAVFALDAQTGIVRWITPDMRGCGFRLVAGWNAFIDWAALSDYFSLPQTIGTYRLLGAHKGTVYLDANNNTGVHALDTHTGKERWHSENGGTPISVTASDTHIYAKAYTRQGFIIAILRAADGTLEHTLPLQQGRDRPLVITDQGIIYLVRDSQVCALRISNGEPIWCTSQVWEESTSSHDIALRAYLSDHTLSYCNTHLVPRRLMVGALDRQSGKKLWEWIDTEHFARASNEASMVAGHGNVYLAMRQGLFAFRDYDGHMLWHALPTTDLSFVQPVLAPTM